MTLVPPFGDDTRTGQYRVSGVDDHPRIAWRAATTTPVDISPLLIGDHLVALDRTGTVTCWNARTGELRWSVSRAGRPRRLDGVPAAGLAAFGELLFVMDEPQAEHLVVRSLRTGEILDGLGPVPNGFPTVVSEELLIHGFRSPDEDVLLSLPDLTERWRVTLDQRRNWTHPAVDRATGIAYGARQFEPHHVHGGVGAFDLATGKAVLIVNEVPEQEECPECGEGASSGVISQRHPVVVDGLVWVTMSVAGHCDTEGEAQAIIVGVNPANGRLEKTWRSPLSSDAFITGTDDSVTAANGRLFFLDYDEASSASVLTSVGITSMSTLWNRPLPGTTVGPAVVAQDTVYLATSTGTLTAVDEATGDIRWTLETGESITWPDLGDWGEAGEIDPAVIPADRMLYLRTSTGILAVTSE
ncbi:PQQ-binding-like beta-propeller repeat protein [Streptomyces sp. NPDC093149]|uniref:outer membrane protein assembly factor BamB family protein n=1 Tax=Streptomyces sp. NPDC093149 TaxID=3366031 RepID=UPI00380F41F6